MTALNSYDFTYNRTLGTLLILHPAHIDRGISEEYNGDTLEILNELPDCYVVIGVIRKLK